MDFDSIISFLLILLFFIFPTLLKRFNKKKKTIPSQAGQIKPEKAKKLSLFEKLGEQIRDYAQTLEQEAQQGNPSPENIWEQLAGEEELQPTNDDPFDPVFDTPDDTDTPMAAPPVFAAASVMPEKKRPPCDSPGPGSFRSPKLSSSQLQQAIIWSEILSKPVALRQD